LVDHQHDVVAVGDHVAEQPVHRHPVQGRDDWPGEVAAPMVWATVLRVRMAASGRSTSAFMVSYTLAQRSPCALPAWIWVGVIVSSDASRIEQRKETPRASST